MLTEQTANQHKKGSPITRPAIEWSVTYYSGNIPGQVKLSLQINLQNTVVEYNNNCYRQECGHAGMRL